MQIGKILLNNTEIKKVYLGDNLVFDFAPIESGPPSYKYFKWFIDSIWSSWVRLYEVEFMNVGEGQGYYTPSGVITASSQYSSTVGSVDEAFDVNMGTYWHATNTAGLWLQIELSEAISLAGFRWNTWYDTQKPKDFRLMASTDGTTWEQIHSGQSPNTHLWAAFTIAVGGA